MSPRIPLVDLPAAVRCRVEISAGGRVKWGADGGVDFVSPVACPFNYGSSLEHVGADGDPADVLVLGGVLARGAELLTPLWGRVRFVDAGVVDDKWVGGDRAPSADEIADLERFFGRYARVKRWAHRLRGRAGVTRYDGIELR